MKQDKGGLRCRVLCINWRSYFAPDSIAVVGGIIGLSKEMSLIICSVTTSICLLILKQRCKTFFVIRVISCKQRVFYWLILCFQLV